MPKTWLDRKPRRARNGWHVSRLAGFLLILASATFGVTAVAGSASAAVRLISHSSVTTLPDYGAGAAHGR